MPAVRGFGIAGALDHQIVEALAVAAEHAGYASFWANDTPGGDGLAALAAAARVTDRIDLGVGVIPVDRTPSDQIANRVAALHLPIERTIVGLGSGGARSGAVAMVEQAVTSLRSLSGVRVYVGALGPRMCELGGRVADGLLLNWLTPAAALKAASLVQAAAQETARPVPVIAAYVRVALPAGQTRLQMEADRYARFPHYASHFARMGVDAISTSVHGRQDDIQRGLSDFDGTVDEVIVRAITAEETTNAYLELLEASSPVAGDRT